jgi:ketosteroid isomerase-like protein
MTFVRGKTAIPICLGFFSLLLPLGCGPRPLSKEELSALDTRPAEEAAIRLADSYWVKAAQSKQVDAWMTFYADDAVVLPPNERMATDKDSIRKSVGELLGLPGLSLSWEPTNVEVARSGDLAYLYGAYVLTSNDAKGKPVTDHGKNVEIWKKQGDGHWKCIVDTWNSDLPTEPAAK